MLLAAVLATGPATTQESTPETAPVTALIEYPLVEVFDGIEYVYVPGNEELSHFWIGRYEVTNGQFVVDEDNATSQCRLIKFAIPGEPDRYVSSEMDYPVVCITAQELQDYCESHNARLPTQKEWLHAAQGPEKWPFPWGEEWNIDNTHVNVGTDGIDTHPVTDLPEGDSWIGARQMMGNVSEFVSLDPIQENKVGLMGWSRDEVPETIFDQGNIEAISTWEDTFIFNFAGGRCVRDFNWADIDVSEDFPLTLVPEATPEATEAA